MKLYYKLSKELVTEVLRKATEYEVSGCVLH